MDSETDIYRAIPHRPPFLFVDRVIEMDERRIVAEKTLDPGLDFFRGHYPRFPVMPGVLSCESVFQAAAILLAQHVDASSSGVPVLTRIRDARFRKIVRPGDIMQLEARIEDRLDPAFYMKGSVKIDGAIAVSVSFTCALVPLEGAIE